MKPVQYSTLEGLKLTVLNYESVEEGDAAAGRVNAILDEANKNLTYRGALAIGRSALCEELAKVTGIAVKTHKEPGKDGTEVEVVDETEGTYVKRVRAEKGLTGNDPAWLSFAQPIADAVSSTGDDGKPLAVDIKEPVRTAKPKTLPANYKEAATRIFTNGSEIKWFEKFGLTFGEDRDKNIELLGWAIRGDVLAKQKEQEAAYA